MTYYRTKRKEGRAVQYTGKNLMELEKEFPKLTFKFSRSKTTYDGGVYQDIRVASFGGDEDLITVGDWLMDNEMEWFIIPMCEFEEYWEEGRN